MKVYASILKYTNKGHNNNDRFIRSSNKSSNDVKRYYNHKDIKEGKYCKKMLNNIKCSDKQIRKKNLQGFEKTISDSTLVLKKRRTL